MGRNTLAFLKNISQFINCRAHQMLPRDTTISLLRDHTLQYSIWTIITAANMCTKSILLSVLFIPELIIFRREFLENIFKENS